MNVLKSLVVMVGVLFSSTALAEETEPFQLYNLAPAKLSIKDNDLIIDGTLIDGTWGKPDLVYVDPTHGVLILVVQKCGEIGIDQVRKFKLKIDLNKFKQDEFIIITHTDARKTYVHLINRKTKKVLSNIVDENTINVERE